MEAQETEKVQMDYQISDLGGTLDSVKVKPLMLPRKKLRMLGG